MQDSLSILLPVHNSQSSLTRHVTRILDVAGELTDHLQVLLIDNGSTDHTFEVAHELSVRYPQVEVIRSEHPRALDELLASHQRRIKGGLVMLHGQLEGRSAVELAGLLHLWNARFSNAGRPATARHRYGAWQAVSQGSLRHTQFRADPLQRDRSPNRPNFLSRIRDFALGE